MGSKSDAALGDARVILDAIRRIVRELRVSSREAEKRAGLSSAQLFVLQKLAAGRALSLNELAARTLTHQSSVSVVVQKLVERGLVMRAASLNDGRQIELALTLTARKLIRKWPEAAQDSLINAVVATPPTQRREMARSLVLLCENMGLAGTKPAMLFEDESQKPKRKRKRKPAANTNGNDIVSPPQDLSSRIP